MKSYSFFFLANLNMKWKKSSIKCTPKRHVLYIIKISQNIAQKNSYLQKIKTMLEEEQKKGMKTSRDKAMTEHGDGRPRRQQDMLSNS